MSATQKVNRIYLIQTKEHLGTDIYKFGKTTQPKLRRFDSYTKGYILHCIIECKNCTVLESKIKEQFKLKYQKLEGPSLEYYKGNVDDMNLDMDSLRHKEDNVDFKPLINDYLIKQIVEKYDIFSSKCAPVCNHCNGSRVILTKKYLCILLSLLSW